MRPALSYPGIAGQNRIVAGAQRPATGRQDAPDDDHRKTGPMFLLDEVQAALGAVR